MYQVYRDFQLVNQLSTFDCVRVFTGLTKAEINYSLINCDIVRKKGIDWEVKYLPPKVTTAPAKQELNKEFRRVPYPPTNKSYAKEKEKLSILIGYGLLAVVLLGIVHCMGAI